MKTYSIEHKEFPPRGNAHGYSDFDEARDLAARINRAIGEQGCSTSELQASELLAEMSTEEQRRSYGLRVVSEDFEAEE